LLTQLLKLNYILAASILDNVERPSKSFHLIACNVSWRLLRLAAADTARSELLPVINLLCCPVQTVRVVQPLCVCVVQRAIVTCSGHSVQTASRWPAAASVVQASPDKSVIYVQMENDSLQLDAPVRLPDLHIFT